MDVILLVGATGLLGSHIAERLAERSAEFRALVRPTTDASALERSGVSITRGDLREPKSLLPAVAGVATVISTANVIARALGGETDLTIRDVDELGNANLIAAAEQAGVERFVFLSGQEWILASRTPFALAKLATEERLRSSAMREVIVRPDMFQEVWLSSLVQFDWPNRSVTIFGKGEARHRYVGVEDVAQAAVEWALAPDPPADVAFGGPEALTRNQAADAFEKALGTPIKRRHVPRLALRLGSTALRRIRPPLASVMGQALSADLRDSPADDAPLQALGMKPRAVSDYIAEAAGRGK
jgi:NADH dehydrogenase